GVRIEASDRDDLLHLGDADPAGGGHRLVEVARGLSEDEIAGLVGLPALDDRKVGANPALEHIFLAVEDLGLLALGDDRPDPRLGVEAGDSRPARSAALGERALRTEFHLKLAGQILPFELLVLA